MKTVLSAEVTPRVKNFGNYFYYITYLSKYQVANVNIEEYQ